MKKSTMDNMLSPNTSSTGSINSTSLTTSSAAITTGSSLTTLSVTKNHPMLNADRKISGKYLSSNINGDLATSTLFGNGDRIEYYARPARKSSDYATFPSTSGDWGRATLVRNGAIKRSGERVFSSSRSIKRRLSERAEYEARYPLIDMRKLRTTWVGSSLLRSGRNSGVGLYNGGNTCFMNATFQIIVHTPTLGRFFAEEHPTCVQACLLCELGRHVRRAITSTGPFTADWIKPYLRGNHLYIDRSVQACLLCELGRHVRRAITSTGPFTADWIKPYLRGIFPAHIYGNQEDAHEFWTLLLAALDSAASNGMKNSGYNGSPKKNGEPRLTTRLEQMFYGKLRHENRCQSCAGFSVSHEQLQELNLAVQIDNHQGSIGLDDLLRAHFGNEVVNLDCAV
ncbi:unnamed protein product [Gongylonema pulchrum]|uniref:Ubiquitin carboxyl-terminal hydrolase 36 n=1 Tax=Gongylonema pulchrum TaxID=637853 RepID=A0A183DYM9_9BILA|nr:unnamed protein product [Gongylonema pulchrum]